MPELAITAVVVHRDGAMVERRGRLPIVDGVIVVSKLPILLEERSIRVEIAGADLIDHRFALDVAGIDRGEEVGVERERWEAAADVRRLEAEAAALRNERATVWRLLPGNVFGEDRPAATRIAAWASLGERLNPWAEDVDARLRALSVALDKARERQAIAEVNLARSSTEGRIRRWVPTRQLVVRVRGAEEADVAVSYRVEAAAWVASYALFATGSLRRGTFAASALVAQATGEDWTGVKIAFSTTPSAREIDVPDLPALRLGKAQPPPRSAWRDLPADLDALFPDEIEVSDPVPAPSAAPAAMHGATFAMEPDEPTWDGPTAGPMAKRARRRSTGGRADELDEAMLTLDDAVPTSRAGPAAPPPMQAMPVAAMPAPQAAFASASIARKSAGVFASVGSAVGGLVSALGEREEAAAAYGGGGGRADLPGPIEVDGDVLDYGNLRMPGADDPRRGRLIALAPADEAREAGLEASAAAALIDHRARARSARASLRFDALPAHHVLPEAVEFAEHRYDADGAVDVPSDGAFRAVSLFADTLDLEVKYRAVPRSDPRAFRTVHARLPRAVPMVAGPVHVHIDGALAIVAPWSGSPRGGELHLGVGVEPNVRVARNVRYREETAGLMGGSRRTHTEVEVEIASALSRQAEVEILDRIPVTRDPEVRVDLIDASPVAEEWKGDKDRGPILDGGRRQVVQVPAGGKVVAKLHYSVTLGGRLELQGGDRRG